MVKRFYRDIEAILRRFYRRCDALVAPSESMAQLLRDQRMNYDIGIWSRGVDMFEKKLKSSSMYSYCQRHW